MSTLCGRLIRAASIVAALTSVAVASGCAVTRPINPPIHNVDSDGYRLTVRKTPRENDAQTLLVLSFSGGGTRAAALSYGVLEEMRRTQVNTAGGPRRLSDEVDIMFSVSGGSFTALSFALYGDRLFDEFEPRFLKRDVEGDLLRLTLDPFQWPVLFSPDTGRSEVAENYYDRILFNGATYGDLLQLPTALAIAQSTEIATGTRLAFSQRDFDVICSDLSKVRLARAATASSAVPVVFSPVTLNNYGGSCGFRFDAGYAKVPKAGQRNWPGTRAQQRVVKLHQLEDSKNRPYLHMVDGGLAGNLGLYGVVEELSELENSARARAATRFDQLRRVVLVVVNAESAPQLGWDRYSGTPPTVALLLQAIGVPIDRYSLETIDALEDLVREWKLKRMEGTGPDRLQPIDFELVYVGFEELQDAVEREYLQNLPTSLSLPTTAVDSLRTAAGRLLRESPVFQRVVKEWSFAAQSK